MRIRGRRVTINEIQNSNPLNEPAMRPQTVSTRYVEQLGLRGSLLSIHFVSHLKLSLWVDTRHHFCNNLFYHNASALFCM